MENSAKFLGDFLVIENQHISPLYSLLKLIPELGQLSEAGICPGQFVQIKTPDNATYLRRPISVCNVDNHSNQLWLLVRKAGEGTRSICEISEGRKLNLLYPLGNGFSLDKEIQKPLLIGGGVGVAPLLYLGEWFDSSNISPTFLLGARSEKDVLLFDEFAKRGDVFISTEDGTSGEKGLVTQHSILESNFDKIYCCGPMPMMKAVAAIARNKGTACEVSLENVMACGMGVCLCCVEKTVKGNLCVCKDGPVFNTEMLTW